MVTFIHGVTGGQAREPVTHLVRAALRESAKLVEAQHGSNGGGLELGSCPGLALVLLSVAISQLTSDVHEGTVHDHLDGLP